jgi:hypothetical protein
LRTRVMYQIYSFLGKFWGRGRKFSNSKILVTGHQGNRWSLVLYPTLKRVLGLRWFAKSGGNGELATWGSKTTSGSATWTASTPAQSYHLSCSLGMPWIRRTTFANWRQPNDPHVEGRRDWAGYPFGSKL